MKPKYDIIPIDGFLAAGIHSGVKRKRKDLGIVISETPCSVAGVFTKNVTKAAPVTISQNNLDASYKNSGIQALLVNSGNANACTGAQGMLDAKAMLALAGQNFDIEPQKMLLASTGVIGVPLDMAKISAGITYLPTNLSKDLTAFGQSIMTTDTYLKVASLKVDVAGKEVSLLGLAKGSGMIHPNMATMLGFIFTDASVDQSYLQSILSEITENSFNMISVDGDTSTNDMVLMMANGKVDMPMLSKDSPGSQQFFKAVAAISESLAIQIAKDGEGATKMIEVDVKGAATLDEARKAAKSVVSSSLVKTAIFGQDANWGRIACALGYSGAKFEPQQLSIQFSSRMGDVELLKDGKPITFDEQLAFDVLRGDVIQIGIELNAGTANAKAWGCDLSYDYVKINGAYRT
jgi:glutamate N-acetyltransferase/amino-acid N-acetyltransferase